MENTMADELRIGLQEELLRKARMKHDADLLKEGVRVFSQVDHGPARATPTP
jgi:hypothetical protein